MVQWKLWKSLNCHIYMIYLQDKCNRQIVLMEKEDYLLHANFYSEIKSYRTLGNTVVIQYALTCKSFYRTAQQSSIYYS